MTTGASLREAPSQRTIWSFTKSAVIRSLVAGSSGNKSVACRYDSASLFASTATVRTLPLVTALQTSTHSSALSVSEASFSRMAQPTVPVSRPILWAAALRFMSCNLLVASPWCCVLEVEAEGCTFVVVVAVVVGSRCLGVYGTYRCGESPVGERRGCAVNDSFDGVLLSRRP